MLEKKFQTIFKHWAEAIHKKSGVFELKVAKISLPFDAVKPHQELALFKAKNKFLYFKLPDDSMGQKPCDSFMVSGVPAYVVILFDRIFFLIDIDKWLTEKAGSKRKSLTKERAEEIADIVVHR